MIATLLSLTSLPLAVGLLLLSSSMLVISPSALLAGTRTTTKQFSPLGHSRDLFVVES